MTAVAVALALALVVAPVAPATADAVAAPAAPSTPVATAADPGDAGNETVVVVAADGRTAAAAAVVADHGRVELRTGELLRARLPADAVATVRASPAVAAVRRPVSVAPVRPATDHGTATAGAGVAAVDAPAAHRAGYTGENVTVGVVDVGFDPTDPAIADRVVATHAVGGGAVDDGRTRHGTAVADVVTDVAPNASLVLVGADTYVGLLSAADWLGNRSDVDVVTMSLGLTGTAPLDGSARLDRRLDRAAATGQQWVVSAGNEGRRHWNGTWRDADGDDRVEFAPGDERLGVDGPATVSLQWRDWPRTDRDYDLLAVDDEGRVLARSDRRQDGDDPPVERLSVPVDADAVAIERVDAPGRAEFDLFSTARLDRPTTARSLTLPATAGDVLAVGAVDPADRTVRPYSSGGPTVDGRLKPDLVAPDGVATATDDAFAGTSAAAPHAAGVAALVLDADGRLSPARLRERLRGTAADLGPDGPDARSGWGVVDADAAVRPRGPAATRVPVVRNGSLPVTVDHPDPPRNATVEVRVRDGDRGAVRARAPLAGETTVDVDVSTLADGRLVVDARVRDALGNANPGGFVATSETTERSGSLAPVRVASVLAPPRVDPGDAPTVRAVVTNPTDRRVAGSVALALDADGDGRLDAGETVDAGRVRVAPGDADAVTLALPALAESGSHTYGVVTDRETATRDLRVGRLRYRSPDGSVTDAGLNRAIRDWARGEIADDRLSDLIRAWARS